MFGSEPTRRAGSSRLSAKRTRTRPGPRHEVVVREDVAVGVDHEAGPLAPPRHVERGRVEDALVGVVAGVLDDVHVDDRGVHPRDHLGERRGGAAEARRRRGGRDPAPAAGQVAERRGQEGRESEAQQRGGACHQGSIAFTPPASIARKAASSIVLTPSSFALSSFEPASRPATTTDVFFETEDVDPRPRGPRSPPSPRRGSSTRACR